jgi:hypothetical protein
MSNLLNDQDPLVHIGRYNCEIDYVYIAKRKPLFDVVLSEIDPELEQRLFDARQLYINHIIVDSPQIDEKYNKISYNNLILYDTTSLIYKNKIEMMLPDGIDNYNSFESD